MVLKPVAIVGWSGVGRFEDLERTAGRKLDANRRRVDRLGDALLVETDDPVSVASRLAFLPGVAWISVGYRFNGSDGYLRTLELLAKRYLSRGGTFKVFAQVTGSDQTSGDAILAGNSALLSSIPKAKVDERRPQVRFRVSIQRAKGACGVEIRAGPGGAPTGDQWLACLVSGGERSSAMAWMAALSGFSLRLVHSRSDEAALRQVAKLYSELSFRMDARCLELVVIEGANDPVGRIGRWLVDAKGATLAGTRPEGSAALVGLANRFPNLFLPLILVQDEVIAAHYVSLGIGRAVKGGEGESLTLKSLEGRSPYSEKKFGGVQADSNVVIDALKRGI
jgi:hypothetical protein